MARTNARGWWLGAALAAALGAGISGAEAAPPQPKGTSAAPSPQEGESDRLFEEGLKLARGGKFAEARPLYERAIALREKASGKTDRGTIKMLYGLASLELAAKNDKRAEEILLLTIERMEAAYGKDNADIHTPLEDLADLYAGQRDFARAVPVAERRIAVLEKALGKDNDMVMNAVNALVILHEKNRDYKRALLHLERIVAYIEKTTSPNDPEVGSKLFELAEVHFVLGQLDRAIPAAERAITLLSSAKKRDDVAIARDYYVLGAMYEQEGSFDKAVQAFERCLVLREKTLAADHPEVADVLNDLALLHANRGDHVKPVSLLRRALAIREKALGPKDVKVATALTNLGEMLLRGGDLVGAEAYFTRALAIYEEKLGPDAIEVGVTRNNVASLYLERGDYKRALPLFERALAIREKALGPNHTDVAAALGNVAETLWRMGDLGRAKPLLERALAIREKAHGSGDSRLATSLANLAALHAEQGELEKAEPLVARALSIQEQSLGKGHPDVAITLNNMAMLRARRGDPQAAEALLTRALGIQESTLGREHPALTATLDNLAAQRAARKDIPGAVAAEARANAIGERHLALVLSTGSADQKLAYLSTLRGLTDMAVALHMGYAPKNPAAAELALTTILQRKGRVVDAMADSTGALRKRLGKADQALLDELAAARRDIARLVLAGPGDGDAKEHQAALARKEAEVERLEAAISARSNEFRAQSRTATLKEVQAALPEGAALVELFAYSPWSPNPADPFGAPHYAAFVLRRSGPVVSVDLGDAASIDAQVTALREALSEPDRDDEPRLSRALDERIMRPVRALLGDARDVRISPDGDLNLVPFAALVDENGSRLIEHLSFTYLTSGRDLLRPKAGGTNPNPPAILADPSFGSVEEAKADHARRKGQVNRGNMVARTLFPPLPATGEEAKALGAILTGATIHTGARATKSAITQLHGPQILHVATHGFFYGAEQQQPARERRRSFELSEDAGPPPPRVPLERPLLSSGLALAGANRVGEDKADGILTALEAIGLDLHGTKLVVLSACETGVGETRAGDGVHGLRRALVMAGAETQVMSLWKVDDEATRDLMLAYYRSLRAGKGRSQAMHDVQRAMLADEKRAHPFYWASFIVSGEASNLAGDSAAPEVPKVAPGARGCGCETAGSEAESPAVWIGIGLASILAARRRRAR
ncbi:CHAT domain-containing tetratricopeptide repeat protein [Polyangium aurulentum]|uniref:CHAT domain-containing tetratricopeptide repeat protein n=1 Tax=Polyangium aurulentum TaxID=2567896 RepID=UPI0010AE0485|nr:tetratricopeptide repeat protein [Polyangium aurulentum]UQA55381.1 tetratricopeptide repeat protein [Polyangium aurulentum]